jgi:chitodextrinase
LSASANDDDSTISDVQFEVDGQVIGTDTTYPYSVNWNSTGVADGSHTLKVNATNADGQTTSSQETFTVANHTCSTAPTAPTGLTATATGLQTMSLSWSASTASSGCSISGYQVYRGGSLITTVTGTTSAESGLTADTAYQFYIKATDNGGHTSAASATVTGTTQADTTPPTAPTNVTATATSSSAVHLSWSASSDNVAVGGYRIYRNGTFYATVSATTTSYTDNDVAANTTYSYTISAIDTSNNESAKTATTPSSVHTPATADTTPPTAPTNLKSVLSTSSTVTLEWSASTDNVGVAGYHVYRGSTLVATVNTTSYTDSDLSPNTTYAYHVVAYDTSANLSAPSSTVNVTTQTGTVVTCSTGDLNADGKVNVLDLSILLSHWSSSSATSCQGDINGDHIVNVLDLSILLSHWSAGA